MKNINYVGKTSMADIKERNKEEKGLKRGVFLIGIGALIGFVNGLLGGGGGMICVPVLEKFLKLEKKKAHATAIAVIFPLSFVSAVVYVFLGVIESLPLVCVASGALLGGVLGAILLKILPEKIVGIIFSVLMIYAGVRMVL